MSKKEPCKCCNKKFAPTSLMWSRTKYIRQDGTEINVDRMLCTKCYQLPREAIYQSKAV